MRKVTVIAVVAVLVVGIAATQAQAAYPKLTGTITCDAFVGSLTLKPPLSFTESTKPIKIKGTAEATNCDSSGVSGGKAPVTGAKVKTLATLPKGTSCGNILSTPFTKSVLDVAWRGTNASDRGFTVGKNHTTVSSFVLTSTEPVTYDITGAPKQKGDFIQQTITLHLELDGEYEDAIEECNGSGIAELHFGEEYHPTISVP
jgi:hypothetical protein